ncbi:MAG: hypothetical protein WH035_07320 [Spirochaetota bacterium]
MNITKVVIKQKKDKAIDDWGMTFKYKEAYRKDEDIWKIHIDFDLIKWGF